MKQSDQPPVQPPDQSRHIRIGQTVSLCLSVPLKKGMEVYCRRNCTSPTKAIEYILPRVFSDENCME